MFLALPHLLPHLTASPSCPPLQVALNEALEQFQRIWTTGDVLGANELLRHNPNVTGALRNELLMLNSEKMVRK